MGSNREHFRLALAPAALLLLFAPLARASAPQLTADAGPDRFVLPPATSVELDGRVRGLRTSGLPLDTTISWAQLTGPQAVLIGADTLTPTVIPSQAGSLRLRLKVKDPQGGVDTDEVMINVFGADQDAVIAGEARKWHKLALTFRHDAILSEGSTPNPFLDLRLIVHFYNVESGEIVAVPGFFAADGDAAETSATAGDRWRANFTPDRAGTWYYVASFRSGAEIALDPGSEAGQPASFDGANGTFEVAPADPEAPGFLARGRLEYVGEHHLRCAETHEYFLEGGANSPENFLGYFEIDNTFDQGGALNDLNTSGALDGVHHYDAHLSDYADLGVPLWKNGRGRRIFGALNYLSARGVNSLYALTYNIDGGDGREVWPWYPATDKTRFDVSKLAQWERVVDHMNAAGIAWHVITQETENDQILDGGVLGRERKLYYRELVARFAHAPALIWNLGEENTNTPDERIAFAEYIRALDPYDHPIGMHNVPGDLAGTYGPLLGTHLELVSLQSDAPGADDATEELVDDSAAAGRPWVIGFHEQGPADDGVVPDAVDFWHDFIRREGLWPALMSQGGGCEWYFGYAHPHSDLDCEDFRSRDNLWRITTRAVDFVREHLPFEDMLHADWLATGNTPSCLAKRGESYAVYLPFGGASQLDLESSTGTFLVSWFDARNGGALQAGSVAQVTGPGTRSLGIPPYAGDWVGFVRRAANFPPAIESVTVEPDPFLGDRDFSVQVHARDPNGPADELTATVDVTDPDGNFVASLFAPHRGGSLHSVFLRERPPFAPGIWQLLVTVRDSGGLEVRRSVSFEAH